MYVTGQPWQTPDMSYVIGGRSPLHSWLQQTYVLAVGMAIAAMTWGA